MPNYPSSQNTDANLYIGVNNLATFLTDNPLAAGATTVNVVSTTSFPTVGILTVDFEAIHYTGTTATSFTGCTRGFDGTSDVLHVVNTQVKHDIPAAHHNVLKDEIKAATDDLRDGFTADLDDSVTPAATATDNKERLDHFATQIKLITGEPDWKDAPSSNLMAMGTSTLPQNIVVNGGLEVWRRGTSFPSLNNGFGPDKWKVFFFTGVPLSTYEWRCTSSNVDNGAFAAELDITVLGSGESDTPRLTNRIEDFEKYRGKNLTLSVRVRSSDSNIGIKIEDSTQTVTTTHTGGGSYETLSVTMLVAAAASLLQVSIGPTSVGGFTTGTSQFDSAMLVLGSSAVAFNPEDAHIELARCQRYYETSFRTIKQVISDEPFAQFAGETIEFKTTKNVTPTITVGSPTVTLQGTPTNSQSTLVDSVNWGASSFGIDTNKFIWILSNSSPQILRDTIDATGSWTAET
jgi:hypothetical protein